MISVRAFRLWFIVVIVTCIPLISAAELEFRCPAPGQIIYKENTAQWHAELTDGAPMLWKHFESAPSPESKSTNGCVHFTRAIIEVDNSQNTYESRLACEYTSYLHNQGGKAITVTLRPAQVFLEQDGRLTLSIVPGKDHWELADASKTLMYECNEDIDACVFQIPQVSIRQTLSGFPDKPVKETTSFRLFALRDQKSLSGWGTGNPVNISAVADTKTRSFNSWNSNLKADSGTRLLVYRNNTEQDAEKFLESRGLPHHEIPGHLRCNNDNYQSKITPERYVVLDIINKYSGDFICYLRSTDIFRAPRVHDEF